jgi:ribulose bisphosphate carboxylase small subunit
MTAPKKTDTPQDRLTRICNTMITTFNSHDEKQAADRAIVFLKDNVKGGIGIAGYDGDDKEAVMDLIVHLRAMFRTHGIDLHVVPVDTTPPKDRA